ncbi:hypothetical protein [Clostridium sp. FP1]|uniref:hypothetical protein n=1 Tax=Clostridium sp. FP1 TaxID=2724076 RepID=UPI0013E94AF3|nr:hypothetical protein [Clostridium sp. FP1]MBZ9635517.1 hypothetical protein [Clostridium sp. FP1]
MIKNIDTSKQIVYAVHVGDYIYVGSGKYERLSGNISKVKRGVHSNKQFQDAYNSILDIKLEILESNIDTDVEARDLENEWMQHYRQIEGVIVCNIAKAVVTTKEYKLILDEEKVIKIKLLLKEGKRNKDIAEIYGVKDCTISKIKTGLLWANVNIENEKEAESIGVDATSRTTFGDVVNL